MKTVYYETMPDPGAPDTQAACLTEKRYWDMFGAVDDGSGSGYWEISAAMDACGAAELSESIFEIPPAGMDALKAMMAEHGFELVKNPAFTAFLAGNMG